MYIWVERLPYAEKMENEKFIQIKPQEAKIESIYKLLIGGILPRPIALISTLNDKGSGNLAPFSFFNGVCSSPPCIMVSIARKPDGSKKDTLINIEETGEFVVNSTNQWILDKVVNCGSTYPYGVNEMEKVGLSPLKSEIIKPPRVKESAFQMECRLYNSLQIGSGGAGSSTVVIGEILLFHISKSVYKEGKISIEEYAPIARLGGANYCSVGEITTRPIPKV